MVLMVMVVSVVLVLVMEEGLAVFCGHECVGCSAVVVVGDDDDKGGSRNISVGCCL